MAQKSEDTKVAVVDDSAAEQAEAPPEIPVATEPGENVARPDEAVLQARIAELEAENDALKHRTETVHASTGRGRNAGAIVLVIIAALVLALAVPAVWMNRMLTDTDVYVATVAPLAQDPDVQNAVAAAASEAVIERVDAQTRIEQVLPENLQIIATPVAQAVNDFIAKQSLTLVRSDKFAQVWETVSRASHKALVTAVTGRDTGAIGVQAGVITLDVGTLASELRTRLAGAGLGFVANLPSANIDKTIVLYESPVLAQLTTAFDLVSRIAYWLPILGLIIAAGAIALAADRRKAVLWLGGAVAIAAILPLQAIYFSQTLVANQLYQLAAIPVPAAQSAYAIVFRDLVTADRALVALGIVLWIGAIVVGPARWAASMRTGLSGGLSGVASHLELGRFGVWVRARRSALRIAGIVAGLIALLLLPAPRTVSAIVWIAVLYLLWLLLVGLLGADPVEPQPESLSGDSSESEAEEVPA